MRSSTPFVSLFLTLVILLFLNKPTAAQNTSTSKAEGNPSQQTGIDPTDIRTRIETAYTYNERESGVTRHNLNIRLEREFAGHGMNIRLDVPLVYSDIPNESSQEGVGDIGIRFNYRYKNTPGYSALLGSTITLDTAADNTLGDGTTKLTGVWVNSWRKKAWLFSGVALATWSESGEKDAAGIVPGVAYQPMKKYLSYVSLGLPIIRDIDDDETATLAIVRFGKVFHGGNVLYLGIRKDLSGKADDDLVITIGYRHMF
ncbi:MAG: hypothetical protein JRE29_00750 [Deltaproteobacteria bacterium]|nr:hypothetical protein [Deltaproteobacteria bacterium]